MAADSTGMMPGPDDNANEIDVERILEEVKQVPTDLRRKLIEQVIETTTQAHMDTVTPTREKVRDANEKWSRKQMEGPIVSHSITDCFLTYL